MRVSLPRARAHYNGCAAPEGPAAQRRNGAVAQGVRRSELVQHRADAPCLVLPFGRRQRAPDGLVQGQAQQRLRHVLLDMGDAQAAGQCDAARVGGGLARDAAQQR